METDWQINLKKIKDRGQYLMQSEKLADCRFLVGTSPNQRLISGHRLLLAMASPIFERMFYGNLTEKNDPIGIPDIQPDAFKAMLNYIYTDEISFSSFGNACELYYVAKKYMLPHVVEHCTNFLLADLSPKNACRAYEFAEFYEEPRLMERSMEVIVDKTREVIVDPSFMDIEVSTLMAILDQSSLNIDSELDLFNCLLKFANKCGILNDGDKDKKTDADSDDASEVVVKKNKLDSVDSNSTAASTLTLTCGNISNNTDEVEEVDSSPCSSGNAGESAANINNLMDAQRTPMDEAMLRQAVKKIRYLTMTPEQFAEGPARSKLLSQDEAFAILIKISSPTIKDWPMPEGFCESRKGDRCGSHHVTLYCISPSHLLLRDEIIDSRLKFKVDRCIYLSGVRFHTLYPDDFKNVFACIQNIQESEIARTTSIKENLNGTTYELTFNSPVLINHDEVYTIKINNLCDSGILKLSWDHEIICAGVKFQFFLFLNHRLLKHTIHSIIFSKEHSHN